MIPVYPFLTWFMARLKDAQRPTLLITLYIMMMIIIIIIIMIIVDSDNDDYSNHDYL